ncbi:unnamed protein product [Rotaria sp. Silwood1]|nr:unnamed protein product [Rotaria sp. Silwood1]CAF0962516.1 unnamed protein product [Rotaria sp. Silwood1]
MDTMVEKTIFNDNQIINDIKPSLTMSFNSLPPRYGSAADIPYDEGFDLKSILNSKPTIPSNDIMSVLNNNNNNDNNNKLQQNQQQYSSVTNNLNELLISYARDRDNLLQIARQVQQDFINAMNLD